MMKKITTIAIVLLLLISCSKSELEEQSNDPIIGKYNFVYVLVDGVDSETYDCSNLNTFEFVIGGVGEANYVSPDNCQIYSTSTLRWDKSGALYTMSSNKPLLEGTGIPNRVAEVEINGNRITASFVYDGFAIDLIYQKQ